MNRKVLNVHMGEIKIAKNGEILKTILGSCVGIGVIWRARSVCGLAHCLLPEIPVKSFKIDGKFVDQAVLSLMAMLKLRSENLHEVAVVLAGGANMTKPDCINSEELVGSSNVQVAKRELEKFGFKIEYSDCGGLEGRVMQIDSKNFKYSVEKIPRIN